ncbi:TPA: bifunctional nicotinamidase/pyrazinamidase [Citrobacter sedlakii]|uniref:bifunctional nicotinamidase/pyrazinamidase n=1 Tax=Citrobacter TaxID=544 RepID=UPI0019028CDC|nr:bifunctional nicotinamidase/pyrazinamidase [Citrobacter sedlakii]MBJ9889028.1 bifunctional nicotinamidase/pyrazinamidase [Citrobacter sedlakii]MCK8145865.1 bifunctional nicotinamidase/pyrazinamidase [Citrobacter sedlakii]HCA7078153.1 bifunctional nicotinamidase/pyrazinamidase [Citrobacter sedlakii]HCA7133956.1 bifunctional nicotinamidase/pyrazinamidase [Citrobacter sedlakii]HCA7138067.1 bifunctional nicotinamidase/pyrazinamidase [Citrobacter sedlakii]
MTQRALLLVDLQNDFCAGGALAVPEGDSTVDVANRLIAWCQARGEAAIASQDWHPANHGSFASQHQVEPYSQGQLDGLAQTFWPDHCVQNTEGAALHPLLNQKAITTVFYKGENPQVDSYSAFFDNGRRQKTALDDWLKAHSITELIVMGLATDYCVKFTVQDALQLGYRVNVITDGCRGVNLQPQDSSYAFMEMAAQGATLYTLDDWEETHR